MVSVDSEFVVLSGDDGLTLPFMACGAKGVVSVASNLIPEIVSEMVDYALGGDFENARSLHLENYNLFTDLFCEPNPVPVKVLMEMAGIIESSEVRLPLCSPSSENLDLLKRIAQDLKFSQTICS